MLHYAHDIEQRKRKTGYHNQRRRMFLMKKIISMVLALSLLCTVCAAFAEGPGGRGGNGGGQGGMRGGNGGGTDKSGDT